MPLSRRDFLKSSVAIGIGTAALPAVWQRAARVAAAEGPGRGPGDKRILVVVQLAGGNDGLNTIVPYSSGRYYDLRGGLGLPADTLLKLNDEVGLHPSLARFKELWDQGALAIVEGVGYPRPNFSHFVSMDIWRSADPDGRVRDGWLGRAMREMGTLPTDFRALAIGNRMPNELSAAGVPVAILENINAYRVQTDPLGTDVAAMRSEALLHLYASFPRGAPFAVAMDSTLAAVTASADAMDRAHRAYRPAVIYPNTPLARGLQLLAEAIDADLGVRVGHVSIGGFDTHATQIPAHAILLQSVSDAVHAFYRDLQAHGRDRDVLIMTWSEFGRRARANGSGGTDHGTAGPLFAVGTPVRGGFYGERPSLTTLDSDNFRFTTDFRSVYASIIELWLGLSARDVLGSNQFQPLGFVSASGAPAPAPTLRPDQIPVWPPFLGPLDME